MKLNARTRIRNATEKKCKIVCVFTIASGFGLCFVVVIWLSSVRFCVNVVCFCFCFHFFCCCLRSLRTLVPNSIEREGLLHEAHITGTCIQMMIYVHMCYFFKWIQLATIDMYTDAHMHTNTQLCVL